MINKLCNMDRWAVGGRCTVQIKALSDLARARDHNDCLRSNLDLQNVCCSTTRF